MGSEKIFLGLDIGTDSIGWAVTDGEYRLKKFKNDLMWGVHLFDKANPSSDRRTFRTNRRRNDRRKQRIDLLQDLFAPELLKKDVKFFLRLKESALFPEDSTDRTYNIYFDDDNYSDKDYFREYPTIHHLICELMDNKSPHDIRLVYLACAYIISHRGHFLSEVDKDSVSEIHDFSRLYDKFTLNLKELCYDEVPFDLAPDDFSEILKNKISKTAKEKKLKELLWGGKKPEDKYDRLNLSELVKFMCGGNVKLSDMFKNDEYSDIDSICAASDDFADKLDMIRSNIDDYESDLLDSIKSMYDWSLLTDILRGHTDISRAKVKTYEEHKNDLELLKKFFRNKKYFSSSKYNEMFRKASNAPNYVRYSHNVTGISKDAIHKDFKKCSQEDFCKFVLKMIKDITPEAADKKDFEKLKEKCESVTLCPKQVTSDNRIIPYQLYYSELKQILANASEYLPFLNEKDEYGTAADKILSIMEFRIPYYVGPLVDSSKSANAWISRKTDGRIYPWNFEDMVDLDESEERFIRRMTGKCTYLAGEDVLPKYSLLYSKYCVLNEINTLAADGKAITAELKQKIYTELFVNDKRKVTKAKIKKYLCSIGEITEEQEISGIDDNVKSSLKSLHDFKRLLSSGLLSENDVENIIEHITVTTDISRLRKWLKKEYSQLPDADIKYISGLKYKDYGRLSRTLLEEISEIDINTGEVLDKNIITRLWETNDNLMQLLSSKYGYSDSIENFNAEYYSGKTVTLEERMKEMYLSPAVRRAVTRTLDISKELRRILKKSPDKIFIEMARGEDEQQKKGKVPPSRREKIKAMLTVAREFAENVPELEKQLASLDDSALRSEKYFLYFMQLGKCMYTGKAIDFEQLGNDAVWNVDHIWPQAKIKDDSLDNKVLVDSGENGKKGDSYPIHKDIRSKMTGFWSKLRENGLLSDKKYFRLVRSTPFSEDELSGFIARQLVETRQSTKAVAGLISEVFPESEIVYVKAGIVSEFRQEYDMLKCREVNDLHHAKDAYLNIVLGNVYNVKFTKSPANFIRENPKYSMNQKTILSYEVSRNGETAWDPKTSFDIVKSMMSKNSIRYVRYTYRRKGQLFKQNPLRANNKGTLFPKKKGLDVSKYGGYDSTTASCFAAVKCGKKSVVIMPVELMFLDKFESDIDFAKEYAAECLSNILSEEITKDMINFPLGTRIIKNNAMLEVDGFRVNIRQKSNKGRTLVISSATSLILDKKNYDYCKKLSSFINKRKTYKDMKVNSLSGITAEQNIELFDILAQKLSMPPFDTLFDKIGKKVLGGRDKFAALDVTEQVLALKSILELLKTGRSTGCDLKAIGESGSAGVLTLNSDFSKLKDRQCIRIIDQSPTGLFEKKSENLLEL
ncbi:MAG: type II CRISPR RNA-guided endonuclease Cas9 [Oscillospiraceae bacterium]|nr:type II CRISPR RNA-guided endonuclease Cas9 [Oscillospiraceae bacterium]